MPQLDLQKRKEYNRQQYLKNKEKNQCEHGRPKTQCMDCGTGRCEHGRITHRCVECGTGMCSHGRRKARCMECGTGHCEHGKQTQQCRMCNPNLCEINIQRTTIGYYIKRHLSGKPLPDIAHPHLGCSAKYLIDYLISKLPVGTTLDGISTDHIKPVSKFDLSNPVEFQKCCHYTNLQPLTKQQNGIISNKWNELHEQYWNTNIQGNDSYREIYIPTYTQTA